MLIGTFFKCLKYKLGKKWLKPVFLLKYPVQKNKIMCKVNKDKISTQTLSKLRIFKLSVIKYEHNTSDFLLKLCILTHGH